ncbi:MAG TPA: ferritin-like domain-containing protein [Candidatus Bathyarchaeia archaeon]|nr:ferritin-like domain-containing protein [Candidatus Bathyarchaeia archaeon]
MDKPFLSDIKELRRRARTHIEEGAVTEGYRADRGTILRLLNQLEGKGLIEMITEDLVAERIAIDSYAEMIRYVGEDDPTTRRMLEGILANEEEHAEDLRTLVEALGKDERRASRG